MHRLHRRSAEYCYRPNSQQENRRMPVGLNQSAMLINAIGVMDRFAAQDHSSIPLYDVTPVISCQGSVVAEAAACLPDLCAA